LDKIQEAIAQVKTLADLRNDLAKVNKQLAQMQQQHTLISGAKLYLEQEIYKMENPAVQEAPDDSKSNN